MGFSFRKSIKLGLVRVNLSKSGLGVSTGVKGARVSVGPRGTQMSVGAGGVYYRTKLAASKKATRRNQLLSGTTGAQIQNPVIPALMSFVLPGLGQMILGQLAAGCAWFAAVLVGYLLFIVPGLILHAVCIYNAYTTANTVAGFLPAGGTSLQAMQMPTCVACGVVRNSHANFCANCGAQLP